MNDEKLIGIISFLTDFDVNIILIFANVSDESTLILLFLFVTIYSKNAIIMKNLLKICL